MSYASVLKITLSVHAEDGQYSAICKELGTATCGDTPLEALKNILEATLVDIETLERTGELAQFLVCLKNRTPFI